MDRINKATLERKVATIARLLNRPKLGLGKYGNQRYRVEDHAHGEDAIFGVGYRTASELWERLDYVETALKLVGKE